jgi:hypothetical protein
MGTDILPPGGGGGGGALDTVITLPYWCKKFDAGCKRWSVCIGACTCNAGRPLPRTQEWIMIGFMVLALKKCCDRMCPPPIPKMMSNNMKSCVTANMRAVLAASAPKVNCTCK